MLITVRAYRHSDLDLMLLGSAMGKNFTGFIRECLRCYLRGVPLRAGIPDIPFVPSEQVTSQSKSTGVMLKDNDDADVIAMLKNIRFGYRNNFVKNVVRMYTIRQSIAAYADNEACYNMLMLPQEAKYHNTEILPVYEPATRPVSKSEYVPKPKFVAAPKPAQKEAPISQTVPEQRPEPVSAAREEALTTQNVPTLPNETPAHANEENNSWGEEDVVLTTPEETIPKTGTEDDEMDVLSMFSGIIGG